VINFRDFGGLASADGGLVRRDRLYRCGHLGNLNEQEVGKLVNLDFSIVADLRYVGERNADPSPWPAHFVNRIVSHNSERHSNAPHLMLLKSGNLSRAAVEHCYHELYGELPFDPVYLKFFGNVISRIADSNGRALIHCTAGKDRTGILVSLILHSLGVSRNAIVEEYMRSSKSPGVLAMKPKIMARAKDRYGHMLSEDGVDMLLDVRPEYLTAAFDAIERKCGSVDLYLDRAGADVAVRVKLRRKLLAV
jgi:protein-tyrosine phosphatase